MAGDVVARECAEDEQHVQAVTPSSLIWLSLFGSEPGDTSPWVPHGAELFAWDGGARR